MHRVVVVAFLLTSLWGCGKTEAPIDPALISLLQSLDESPETEIVACPTQGRVFLVRLKKPAESGAFLNVVFRQATGYFGYRYEIGRNSSVSVYVPTDAQTVDVGIASEKRLMPEYCSSSVVYSNDGSLAHGALATFINRAHSYEDAFRFAMIDLAQTGSTESLLMVLLGSLDDNERITQIQRVIDSVAKVNPAEREIALAGRFFSSMESARPAAIDAYLEYLAGKPRVEYHHVLQSVLDEEKSIQWLSQQTIENALVKILQKNRGWSAVKPLVYNTPLKDTQACIKMNRLGRCYLEVILGLTPYEHVSQTTVKFTFAEIAEVAGDVYTASGLLESVIAMTDSCSMSYHKTSRDPYFTVDQRGWTSAAIVMSSKMLLRQGDVSAALSSLNRYRITDKTSISHDAGALRLLSRIGTDSNTTNAARILVEQFNAIPGKEILRDTAHKYFPSIVVGNSPIRQDADAELVMISSNTCSVCRTIKRRVGKEKLGTTRGFTIFNVDSDLIEFSNSRSRSLAQPLLSSLAKRARAYPTLFLLRGGKVERTYEGSSFEQIQSLTMN
ncbi:MAG TPA: hypothetical protein VK147_00850 [Candidatus Didemnitutus sp.]|nr:hypothetical protein [Candidatus Didemnitutus sp.]